MTLAERVVILTHTNVGYHDHPLQPHFPATAAPVALGRGCFVGASVTILPGVTIGPESFVAAGSVVTADVPPRTLVAGVPARPVRERVDGAHPGDRGGLALAARGARGRAARSPAGPRRRDALLPRPRAALLPVTPLRAEGLRVGELRYWNPYVHEGVPLPLPAGLLPVRPAAAAVAGRAGLSLLLALHVPLAALCLLVLAARPGLSVAPRREAPGLRAGRVLPLRR